MGVKKLINNVRFKTGMANCAEYMDLIHDVIDDQATPDQEVYLRRHLKMCLKCVDHLNLEQELKMAIKQKIVDRAVPSDLAESIRTKIENTTL
ncbi:zf-HC2 domain-containing protein [Reichenbachiella ulvae]|uniref:Zf-HC2 domain-containing protein n=1 Tax=Reichenbachiella ulvae TaxID=2980104 RepID=A0ABT3CW11_9BACT|nr:zf-HC2 domain-containing protein [Reichenbachiella ulvae]MCV9387699.1 zf-HC2 domain-containing protein [Reichenbachiella ulvae]